MGAAWDKMGGLVRLETEATLIGIGIAVMFWLGFIAVYFEIGKLIGF